MIKTWLNIIVFYLQQFCVIEVSVIVFFSLLNAYEIHMFFKHVEQLPEFAVIALMSFNAASFKIIEKCIDSINIEYNKD
jgi:hypothetical protein